MFSPILCLALVGAFFGITGRNIAAFPQNGPGNSFEVDGFIFDGPATRSPTRGNGDARATDRTTDRTVASTTVRTTFNPPVRSNTASTAAPALDFDACVTSCPVTPEYNPVCGSNNVNYENPGQLTCATICGEAVSLNYYGRCGSTGVRG